MIFEKIVASGLLSPYKVKGDQIEQMLARARKDLETAEFVLRVDPEAGYDFAYKAMMHAGRALIYGQGYRPTARQTHKTIVECTQIVLGSDFKDLTLKFDKMRKKRHLFTYESPGITSAQEAKKAIADGKKLVSVISEKIR